MKVSLLPFLAPWLVLTATAADLAFKNLSVSLPASPVGAPQEACPIDFDGDGLTDLIVAQLTPPTYPATPVRLLAMKNMGSGKFEDRTSAVLGEVFTIHARDMRTADFNGDGLMDLVVADHGTDIPPFPGAQSRLFIQTADGRLLDETATRLPKLDAFSHHVSVGDIDGDGDVDIYFCNIGAPERPGPQLLLNNGSGVFKAENNRLPGIVANLTKKYTSSEFFDADGDGDLDLFLGGHGGNLSSESFPTDALLINDGKGRFSFAPEGRMPPRHGGPDCGTVAVASADFDGDGSMDLLLSTHQNYAKPSLQLLLNDGHGSFSDASAGIPQSWPATGPFGGLNWIEWIRIADLNGDGKPDVVCNRQNAQVSIFLNQGGGKFIDASSTLSSPPYVGIVATADFDGDGSSDVYAQPFGRNAILARNISLLAPQSIAFGELGAYGFGSPPIALTATASSGLPVRFEVVSGPGRLVNGLLEFTGVGSIAVRASQPGDARHVDASSERICEVLPAIYKWRALPDGKVELTFRGPPIGSYLLQTSSDFKFWSVLDASRPASPGDTVITVPASASRMFYKFWLFPF